MIELGWSEFKTQVLSSTQWQWIYFEVNETYLIYAKQNDFCVMCKIAKDSGIDQVDFETNYQSLASTKLINNVQSRFEREDIRDQMSRAEAAFDENGEAEISLLIPGTPGSGDGRYIGGGYATLDAFHPADACVAVAVVDVDNLLGMGAENVLATYHDADVALDNQGWYAWAGNNGTGEIEVEPMGYYGFIPSGMYLELYFKKHADSTASKVYVNFWMGKQTT